MAYKKRNPRGRNRGTPNLQRGKDGTLTNQHGVTFTADEKRALENAVKRARRLREKQLREWGEMPRMAGGKPTGDTVATLQKFGKESDFIIKDRTASLQRFTSRKQFTTYLKKTQGLDLDTYVDKRTREYKSNYMEALRRAYGADADDVIKKVRYMRVDKFRQLIEQDEDLEIRQVYPTNGDTDARLNRIRFSFGLEMQDDFYDDEEW